MKNCLSTIRTFAWNILVSLLATTKKLHTILILVTPFTAESPPVAEICHAFSCYDLAVSFPIPTVFGKNLFFSQGWFLDCVSGHTFWYVSQLVPFSHKKRSILEYHLKHYTPEYNSDI